MEKVKTTLKSFYVRVVLALIFGMLFIAIGSNYLIYRFTLNVQFEQLRDKLMVIAQTAALTIDARDIQKIPLKKSGIKTKEYKKIAKRLNEIKGMNKPIKYIYTMAKSSKDGIWQFIVDPTPPTNAEEEQGLTSYPGDEYDVSRFPEMMKAFHGPSADTDLVKDEWGVSLSGYAPIRDESGKAVAILGVDMMADAVYLTQREVHKRMYVVLAFSILLSLFLGIIISNGITNPVKKLLIGTRNIAKNNFEYKVELHGPNEIEELTRSFNSMAESLKESKRKLRNYFYRTVQSLVRILEAKDVYTRGHSERVADYAEKIAKKLNYTEEQIEYLREAALLHDIGKLGITENILNKKEKLSDAEWELLVKHTIVGEDILKPIFEDEEMPRVARQHHEKFDGSGYPDKIRGENINVFAQIVSIADSYDAMTSNRAYRNSLGKEKAIKELKDKKNSQFNPEIVDLFVDIISSEKNI